MRIVVTGATGFIGSAFCNHMLKEKHEVTAIVRPNSKKTDKLLKGIKIVELSLDELGDLEGQFDVFYHFAWNGSSGNDRNDVKLQQSNILYTIEAMKIAKQCGCYKFVGAGSQAEYGVVKEECNEETTPHPFMMYGATKLATYHIAEVFSKQIGIEFVWPRIYSVYGGGQNEGTLISYVIDCLQKGIEPQLTSCENMWDFIHIKDCVQALKILGEKSGINGIYNISYGRPRVLKEFIGEIGRIINPNINIQFGAKQVDSNKTFWLEPDVSKIKALGFKGTVSFDRGIREIIDTIV